MYLLFQLLFLLWSVQFFFWSPAPVCPCLPPTRMDDNWVKTLSVFHLLPMIFFCNLNISHWLKCDLVGYQRCYLSPGGPYHFLQSSMASGIEELTFASQLYSHVKGE